MGITICATNESRSFYMGYGGFIALRNNIALAFNKKFGEHYKTLPFCCFSQSGIEAYDKMANQIIETEHLEKKGADVLDFLYASDCGGKVGYKTCKKIYDLIKDIDFGGKIFTYAAYSDGKDYEHFKEFLLNCYKHRRNMRWQ